MWFSFWRSRDRLSLHELRFIVDQLTKVQVVNEVNKEFVIEALRSIAELITYGDQHDAAYFEFFMEKQVMGECVRILRICESLIVSRQLLQTMSIMIQNLKNDHSIYYMFRNEHVNYLIAYPFDFGNEELLSYYISFLRAISGKLNKDTISLLVKTKIDEVVDFPLYVEAIRFAFHEESMIRTAVRTLTLNVYHVGDDTVNRFVSRAPHSDYFLHLIEFFRDRCIHLNTIVSNAKKSQSAELSSSILSAVDEIEDNLYYISDVVSAGIPDVGRSIMDKVLRLLIFPLVLPSLGTEAVNEPSLGAVTSLYLLCCILRIVKIKDLANIVVAALLCHPEMIPEISEAKINGNMLSHASSDVASQNKDANNQNSISDTENHILHSALNHKYGGMRFAPREALLSFVVSGDEVQVSGSLNVLATLLQTKELDESIVDALGILPQCKQHKKKLLQALVGEDSAEEQLFSSEGTKVKDRISGEFDIYLQKLKEYVGISCVHPEVGASPRLHRFQVLDSLVSLFCRSNISAETLWHGGWLLRQLLPYSKAEFNSHHLTLLTDSFHHSTARVLEEARGTWFDLLLAVICDQWRKCKRAIEASSLRKDPKCILLPPFKSAYDEHASSESSFAAGERMCEAVKVFALLHHLHIFSLGKVLPDQPPVFSEVDTPEKSRARNAGLNLPELKPNAEINLVGAISCRIAFERGKERHFLFLALSMSSCGWLVLAEELPVKPGRGLVRVVAPLAGCNPRVDDKHLKWLHLRIRPSSFPFTDTAMYAGHGKVKSKALVDGRWTLAFQDEESCKNAMSMVVEEMELQSCMVEKSLEPLLELDRSNDDSRLSERVEDDNTM
ncbi:protein TRANSPARENT TESTA 9-like isoform X1 [Salvia hispanica]|uniref:protein TRANSPARENT TESTA 9-like isoform X1 n=2 Tax=Salvia hispanica TaxID=49212 RepID=UPI00200972BC|nr:protein TRANSPARENT TESTA 9-like isoform X1 [Salvia hispanica]